MFRVAYVGMARSGEVHKVLILGLLAAVLILLLVAQPALAVPGEFVVNRKGDEPEPLADRGNGACDALPAAGNQCSLRAAIQEANANANPGDVDVIDFNIPGDPKKVKTIKPTSELPALTQSVTIDGYTQPGSKKNTRLTGAINAAPKVQLDGSEATGSDVDGLIIQGASNITIRGLIINRFDRSGIFLTSTDGSDDNHFEGNFVGTNATGTADLGNGNAGVEINGLNDDNVVGGNLAEQRNVISGNDGDGVFAGTDGDDTIQGNLIGTDKTGLKDIHNGTDNNGEGVNLGGQKSVVKDNIIAFNTSDGVQVRSNATGVGHDIGPNSIFSNDGMGIDIVNNAENGLGPNGDGPNTNDGDNPSTAQEDPDSDTGPNNLQNFPTITSATTSSTTGQTTIRAFLNSVPSTQFTIRFYSNPRDTGEGKTFLGDKVVSTDANGNVSISGVNSFLAAKSVPVGQSITATATDSAGNTSEFTGEPRSVRSAP